MAERSRGVPGAVVAALAVVLACSAAGCASIPSSGPVRAGASQEPVEDRGSGIGVAPIGPVAGASPLSVVRGFLLAGVGVDDDFAVARDYLAADRRGSWRPTARTVVHAPGELDVGAGTPAADGSTTVTVSAQEVATVDDHGVYTAAGPGAVLHLDLRLVREDGQWRIADAPNLLLLDQTDFDNTFSVQPLYFVDRSSGRLVPDLRWFLDRPSTATTAVDELLAGPPEWLAPAVSSGDPDHRPLARGGTVPISPQGVAEVDLPAWAQRSRPAALAQLEQQLTATLVALPQVYSVRVTVEGGLLPPAAAPEPEDAAVDPSPVVLDGQRLARLRDGALQPVGQVPDLAGLDVAAPAVLGSQYAVLAAQRTQLLRLPAGRADRPAPALTGVGLTAPSLDRYGWAWSTSAASTGTVTAVGPQGDVAQVEAGWLAGRRLVSLRASRDGSRVVIASTSASADAPAGPPASAAPDPDAVRVDVAAVRRGAGGAPQGLTAAQPSPTPWLATVAGAVWVDSTTVAVLGVPAPGSAEAATSPTGTAPSVWLVSAGQAVPLGAPASGAAPVRLACGDGPQSLLVGTADGGLWRLAGAFWARVEAGGADPAFAG